MPSQGGQRWLPPSQVTGRGLSSAASRAFSLRQDSGSGAGPELLVPRKIRPRPGGGRGPPAAPAPRYSQEGLNGAVRLQGLGQLLDAVDVGDDAQVEVELSEGAGLGHPAADVPEVPLGELAAPQRQQPHRVLPQALADVPDLRPRQRLPGDLDRPRQHLSAARSAADAGGERR